MAKTTAKRASAPSSTRTSSRIATNAVSEHHTLLQAVLDRKPYAKRMPSVRCIAWAEVGAAVTGHESQPYDAEAKYRQLKRSWKAGKDLDDETQLLLQQIEDGEARGYEDELDIGCRRGPSSVAPSEVSVDSTESAAAQATTRRAKRPGAEQQATDAKRVKTAPTPEASEADSSSDESDEIRLVPRYPRVPLSPGSAWPVAITTTMRAADPAGQVLDMYRESLAASAQASAQLSQASAQMAQVLDIRGTILEMERERRRLLQEAVTSIKSLERK